MTDEELEALSQKMADDSIAPTEKLALLKELNKIMEDINYNVLTLKNNKNVRAAREDIDNLLN
jgi:hypothetical protein